MGIIKVPIVDIKNIEILNIKTGYSPATVYRKYKPDILMSLTVFDKFKDNLIINSEDTGIGLMNEVSPVFVNKKSEYQDGELSGFVYGYPSLLPNMRWGIRSPEIANKKQRRCILGFNNMDLILYCTEGTYTLEDAAILSKKLGMKYAINCNVDGACHLQKEDKVLLKSKKRRHSSWLMIYLKEKIHKKDFEITQSFMPFSLESNVPEMNPTSLAINILRAGPKHAKDGFRWLNSSKKKDKNNVDFHVVVDEEKAIQYIPFNRYPLITSHGNLNSIGIVICENGDLRKVLRNLILSTSEILDLFGWQTEDITHNFKWDENRNSKIFDIEERWEWFLKEVRKELGKKLMVRTTVSYDGRKISGFIVNGVTYTPVKYLAESLNKTVVYDPISETTTLK